LDRELPEKKPASPENSVGINLVPEKISTLSSGIAIDNPRFIRRVGRGSQSCRNSYPKGRRGQTTIRMRG